jgi:hypothetical protein
MPIEIFKIQLPISSNEAEPMALIYNKDRSEEMLLEASKVAPAVAGELKSFWYGLIEGKTLVILTKAPWQDW